MIALLALLIAAPADPLVGTWEGTSLCQVKPSPCHDEYAVYRVARSGPRRYRFEGYKLVAGEEQFMGTLDLIEGKGTLTGSNVDRSGAVRPWIFLLKGTHLSGRALTSVNGRTFRLIELDRR